ncbi:MAG: efflux RND transporter periplasmic adaptor subunit [Niabella sp.]|nr:efflux RND transporter periplasmic adaptor subunit [Niabella sp.]
MNFRSYTFWLCSLSLLMAACHSKTEEPAEGAAVPDLHIPVTVAHPTDTMELADATTLNAISTYLLRSDVKANATGYVTKVHIKLSDLVHRGQVLFGLETKEARALGNTINHLDPSFRFSGSTTVVSPATGYVAMLNHQVGDYVQDGEVLATVTDAGSFGFVMNVPYEYNQLVHTGGSFLVHLPDGRTLNGQVAKIMPSVDSLTQTQKVLIKVKGGGSIPENLIATVQLVRKKAAGIYVPKTAVLTDDAQTAFWVMKLINDSIAVKTDIKKGTENDKWVEVVSDGIKPEDRIITVGNYGMGDTATIKIQKTER